MPDDVREYMRALMGHQVPFVSILHARHHVMLDQPIAFISARACCWPNGTIPTPTAASPGSPAAIRAGFRLMRALA